MRFVILLSIIPYFCFGQSDKELSKLGIDSTGGLPMGLLVGDSAPVISGIDALKNPVNSKELMAKGPVVVIFYRGEWCPYCNRHLNNLSDSLELIKNEGAEVLVIGPETFENSKEYTQKLESNFILLPDTSLKYMTAFDVLFKVNERYQKKIKAFLRTDIAENNGQKEAALPVPATYIIDQKGKIAWRHFNYQYSERASALSILNALDSIKNQE